MVVKEDINNTFEDTELKTIYGRFTPQTLFMYLNSDKEDLLNHEKMAIYIHEQLHFFQSIMTGFGQEGWHLHNAAYKEIIKRWIELTNDYPNNRPLPLGYLTQKHEKHKSECALLIDVIKESLLLHNTRTFCDKKNMKFKDLSIRFNGTWDVNPIITIGDREYEVNGLDVIETHAKVIEALYLYICDGIPIIKTIYPLKLDSRYYTLFYWFLFYFDMERTLIEFPVICDLALQTSWGLDIKTEKQWKSYHPAWRFIKLTEALKRNITPSVSTPKEMVENYNEYCDNLLRYCEFESLNCIFEQFKNNDPSMGGFLYNHRSEYLNFRKKHLWCGANPLLDHSTWKEMCIAFSPRFIQYGDVFEVIGEMTESSDNESIISCESIVDIHLYALSLQIQGIKSDYAIDIEQLQCAFGYFGYKNACPYQTENRCNGSFFPNEGLPSPIAGTLCDGCTFEVALEFGGLSVTDIDVNFRFHKNESILENIN